MRYFILITLIFLMASCGKKEVRNGIPANENPSELLKYGDQFYHNGDYENAFRAYGIVYYDYPSSREYIDAAIGLSKCYGAMQSYEKQFEILHNLLRENLIPTKVPGVYNAVAEFYERSAGISEQLTGEGTNDYKTAISYYNKSIQYPNSDDLDAKSFAQYKIGTLYEKMKDYPKAIEAYETALNTYQGTEWALRAEQNILDIQERMRRRAEYQQSGMLPADTTTTPPAQIMPPPMQTNPMTQDSTNRQ
jgi:tetratricopeptide (TPR) repeat protein